MKELSDEYIQALLEDGIPIPPGPDVTLYETIFKELNTHPGLNVDSLPADVIKILQYKLEWQNRVKSWIIAAILLIIGSVVFILAAGSIDIGLSRQIMMFIYHYKWIGLFIIILVAAAEIIDRMMLVNRHKAI